MNLATSDNKKLAERFAKLNDGGDKFRAIMFGWPRKKVEQSKKVGFFSHVVDLGVF
jgi:hypothetical protein